MSLPNYTPSGKVLFGAVPWDNSYVNVRLYTSLTDQYNDIANMMTVSSEDYTYIGRNRRLKVAVEADRLYHCNYCMYRNESLTDGWIYCFITDVEYINDHTSEITLETDVFNTYVYEIDWSIPPCFIERETVPREDSKYLLTSEPDFPLVYQVDAMKSKLFDLGGWIVATGSTTEEAKSLADILNPSGWKAKPAPTRYWKGVPLGCSFHFCDMDTSSGASEELENVLNSLSYAGVTDAVAAIFSVPKFAYDEIKAAGATDNIVNSIVKPDAFATYSTSFLAPERGDTVDGYAPVNKKLLYYPYTYLNLTDYNGSSSQLRYELLGGLNIAIKYALGPQCQAIAFPLMYMGVANIDFGIVTQCGALGSWNSNYYQNWLAQNAGSIALSVAGAALSGIGGAVSFANAARTLSTGAKASHSVRKQYTKMAERERLVGMGQVAAGAATAGSLYSSTSTASHQPSVTRGQLDMNTAYSTGIQGVYAQKITVKREIAQQIDEFFSRFGYSVERIEGVNIVSRPNWNYVKTVGSAPKSLNTGSDAPSPFSRGRGTPADALAVIQNAFDNGVTFWHTTSGFGNFQLANGL